MEGQKNTEVPSASAAVEEDTMDELLKAWQPSFDEESTVAPRLSTPDQFEETMTLLRELEEAMRDIPEVVPTAPSNQAG